LKVERKKTEHQVGHILGFAAANVQLGSSFWFFGFCGLLGKVQLAGIEFRIQQLPYVNQSINQETDCHCKCCTWDVSFVVHWVFRRK